MGHIKSFDHGERVGDSSDVLAARQDLNLDEMGVKDTSILFRPVKAAFWLAFTDWDQRLRLLSPSFLESTSSWRKCLVFKKPLTDVLTKDQSGEIGF